MIVLGGLDQSAGIAVEILGALRPAKGQAGSSLYIPGVLEGHWGTVFLIQFEVGVNQQAVGNIDRHGLGMGAQGHQRSG